MKQNRQFWHSINECGVQQDGPIAQLQCGIIKYIIWFWYSFTFNLSENKKSVKENILDNRSIAMG